MLTARGFHPPCFTVPAVPRCGCPAPDSDSPGSDPSPRDLWTRVVLTPPDTPTSLSPPFPPLPALPSLPSLLRAEPVAAERPPERPAKQRPRERPGDTPAAPASTPTGPTGTGWSLRSRRHRLSTRPAKRLFTPDIKKLLKGWLVRRRDNPYPSRAEKETLATRTGLTYMQVCNWFANWRRKLRDCARPEGGEGGEDEGGGESASWAHLIRRYNALAGSADASTAHEHFSISSGDSIWAAEEDHDKSGTECGSMEPQQNAYVSSTTTDVEARLDVTRTHDPARKRKPHSDSTSCTSWSFLLKRKKDEDVDLDEHGDSGSALLLSKWLESAARYQPSGGSSSSAVVPSAAASPRCSPRAPPPAGCGWGIASAAVEHTLEGRHREELDAAEALAFLSSLNFR